MKTNKVVRNFLKNLCINREEVIEAIIKASSANTYVETVNPKIADSLHLDLIKNYPETLTIEFFRFTKPLVIKQRLGSVALIADITEDNFYGKSSGLYIHGFTGERGVLGKIRYLVVAILYRNQTIPFYLEILPIGAFKAESLGKAIEYCNSLGLKVKHLMLDRGFYSGDVVDTLQLSKVKYLIFAPKNKFIKFSLDKIKNDCIILHDIKYTKNRSTCYAISDHALLHNYLGYDWAFATNIDFDDLTKYVSLYKKRWNIETMFRVHDEAKIKSKSIISVIRLFYFIISMLLLLIWNLYLKKSTTFKRFVIQTFEELKIVKEKASG